MFRIRRIYDDVRPIDREAVKQVQAILKAQFPEVDQDDVEGLPGRLRDPLSSRFRYVLLTAEDVAGKVKGFALAAHAPDLRFCYLDFISAARRLTGGGVGGALYQGVRDEAISLKAVGIFMECLPDDPKLCPDQDILAQNKARLKFYERFGARPIINTAYETPLSPEHDCPPYLVFDSLNADHPLRRRRAREIVRAILERKYGHVCPEGYIDMVVRSFKDDPVQIRTPLYIKKDAKTWSRPARRSEEGKVALVVSDQHEIHHVHERGYVESPVRIRSILKELDKLDIFEREAIRPFPDKHILDVHDHGFVAYLKRMCSLLEPGKSLYPYVFPIRNAARPPKELPVRAGYYCIDTFTPLSRNAYQAARRAVDCALTAADALLQGRRLAYALVRPPGHHAETKAFGGFCYFNSTAVAANYLSRFGRVAVLDLDYHHGNGTQDVFYNRSDVLTLSIHGKPNLAYPYFSGFSEETGQGPGQGFNRNYPLGELVNGQAYAKVLARALKRVAAFKPKYLVIAIGYDTAKGDPTGSWGLTGQDFENNGRAISAMNIPTLAVQEGGYRILSLGANARRFFMGLTGREERKAKQS